MTILDVATKQLLQTSLDAYIETDGGESSADIRAIAGALLSVTVKAGQLHPQGSEIEQWVDQLVADFEPHQRNPSVSAETAHQLATQAKTWRATLAVKTSATLDAYIQKYTPEIDQPTIEQLIMTILPIVEDVTITRDEARRLTAVVSQQVDVPSALSRTIDPQWQLLADKAQHVLQYQNLATSATEVMQSYVSRFQPAAVDVGATLIEQAVEAVFNSQLKLGLDVDLDTETRKLLVNQVMLQFRLREASLPPTKTALEMAQQLHDEVRRYRRDRGFDTLGYLPPITTTDDSHESSLLGGEMSIGIHLQPNRSADGFTSPPFTEEA